MGALSLGTLRGTGAATERLTGREEVKRILPSRLKKGDTVGLVSPGSPITREQLDETVKKLTDLGFHPVYNESVLSEYGYFAGTDRERAEELMGMFRDGEVDHIWCVRGGYGSIRILDLLDYAFIREHPKMLVGYSDITALLTAIHQETGLVTYHGPLGISDFNTFTVRSLKRVLMHPKESYMYPYKKNRSQRNNPEFDQYTIQSGLAEGMLTGGNISVLDSLIGTPYETDFAGKVVFLEEVEEKTYRVDKMLFHLLRATNLPEAAAIVLGVFAECNTGDEPRLSLKQAIQDLLQPLGIPVSYGLTFGHIEDMITLPLGIRARLDADRNELLLLEEAVR